MAVEIGVYKDGLTGGVQISIDHRNNDGGGHGYRIAGPDFSGNSLLIKKASLTERDANEIRRYLDNEFGKTPKNPDQDGAGNDP